MMKSVLLLSIKFLVIISIWVSFFWWIFTWTISVENFWNKLDNKIKKHTDSEYFYFEESTLIYRGFPPMIIAFLSIIYLSFPKKIGCAQLKIKRTLRSVLGATFVFPKPFGIITFGEITGVCLVGFLVSWYLGKDMHTSFKVFDSYFQDGRLTKFELWRKKLKYLGDTSGMASAFTFCLLFFPVSRRSPIMRMLRTPYELAIRYHIWLGHLTNILSTIHSIAYLVLWILEKQVFGQQKIPNFAGPSLFIVSIITWITSMKPIRRRFFEVFFYTHQLYFLYLLFYIFHAGGWITIYAFSSLFLFFLDRLIRFFQSRFPVDILSANVLSNGYIQITLPTGQGLEIDSLGIIFLNVPFISSIQWHPFSVSSRSKETPGYITVLIKPSNNVNSWTSKLFDYVSSENVMPIFVEGPYNSELNYFNRYDDLILVAGGAGITPFVSIIKEVVSLHMNGEISPNSITLIWVVKEPSELELLSSIPIPSQLQQSLSIQVKLFVTKEDSEVIDHKNIRLDFKTKDESIPMNPIVAPIGSKNGFVQFFVTFLTFVGTLLVMSLVSRFLIYPTNNFASENLPIWVKGTIFYVSFLSGIVIFGTLASVVDIFFFSKPNLVTTKEIAKTLYTNEELNSNLLRHAFISYGVRPNWNDEFTNACESIPPASQVGVMACGPPGLIRSTAWECQKRSMLVLHSPRLSYHPLSFEF